MIVVAAATGEYGRLVVERLLARAPAADVAVAVRHPAKAAAWAAHGVAVRQADYDDADSLRLAFDGADRLLFISSPGPDGPGSRVDQHRNVVESAQAVGVGEVLYTSGLGADMVDEGLLGEHHATEALIRESGLTHVFLRHPIYSDYFIHPGLRSAVEAGVLTSNTLGRGLNTASRADLAEAAANLLTSEGQRQTSYNFTGQLWTYPELAAVLAEVSGERVAYREVDEDEGIVGMLGLAPIIRAGAFELQTPDLATVLGHPATDLHAAVSLALTTTTS